jgi:alkaline phosphatase D
MVKNLSTIVAAFSILALTSLQLLGQKKDLLHWTIGHVGMRDAKIFVLKDHEPVQLNDHQWEDYYLQVKLYEGNDLVQTFPLLLENHYAHSGTIKLHSLKPNTQYWVKINDQFELQDDSISFRTQPLWQYRTDPPNLNIAFGSCAYINDPEYDRPGKSYGGSEMIFNSIANKKPDAMIWLGDNVYFREGDWDSEEGMIMRYVHSRKHPRLDSLLRSVPNYAIWDDHDFGPNDSNGSFALKDKSLATFQHFWPNPTKSIDVINGNTSMVTIGDIDFFLLDNRYNRTAQNLNTTPNLSVDHGASILGQDQIHWLINALMTSKASFKIICIGGQFLNSEMVYENYANYGREKSYIMDLLQANKINNVVFLSGDRHCGEISKWSNGDYTLYDLTSSPLTSGAFDMSKEKNAFRMEGTIVAERHFAMLKISGSRKERQLSVAYYNKQGELIFEKPIQFNDVK